MYLGTHLHDYSPPGGRRPPPEVVRGLREIDPRMELVYVGHGKWLMGKVEFANDRYADAVRLADNITKVAAMVNSTDVAEPWKKFCSRVHMRLRERRLMVAGFQPFKNLVLREHHLDSSLVEFFRRCDWVWKFAWMEYETERERLEDMDEANEEKIQELHERLLADYRSIHKFAFRGAVSRRGGADIKDGLVVRPEGATA